MKATHDMLSIEGRQMPLVTVQPPGDSDTRYPALVVIPSIYGVADDLVAQMEQIAQSGALLLAVDPFFRVQSGPIPYASTEAAIARVRKCDLRAGMADFRFALEHARAHPRCNGRVAALGICFGAIYAFAAASRGEVDGVVTWHGSGMKDRLSHADEMRCPMRLHFGAEDKLVGQDTIDAVRAAFAGREDVQITVHPHADHGYSHAGPAHDPAAARASLTDTIALLASLK